MKKQCAIHGDGPVPFAVLFVLAEFQGKALLRVWAAQWV